MEPVDYGQYAEEEPQRKRNPVLPIGVTAVALICGYGAYKWKSRGTMIPSHFLINLRMAAQGTAVGIITLGMLHQMYQQYTNEKISEK